MFLIYLFDPGFLLMHEAMYIAPSCPRGAKRPKSAGTNPDGSGEKIPGVQ